MKNYNIVLIGFMGTGKSAVSRYLGRKYGMKIAEMDQIIAERENKSIPDIFKENGEEYFRNCETELLKELQKKENTVISCGGGAPLRPENVAEMKKNGKVFLLTASPQTVYERVKRQTDRPLLAGRKTVEGIAELMEERKEKYEAAADVVIDTDNKEIWQICEELKEKLSEMEES